MGLERYGVELLALMKSKGYALDRFLMLGRQHLNLKERDRANLERVCGFPLQDLMRDNPDETYAEPFLERFGFGIIESMDFSDYQGCGIVHDMNQPVPDKMNRGYDVVYDGGTLEHIFNFPVAIANCMRMVREGGLFISVVPTNGYCGHGFYQFSPELYYSLFEGVNGFEIELMAISVDSPYRELYRVDNPGKLGHRVGLNSRDPALLLMAAKRVDGGVNILEQMPGQSDYISSWGKNDNEMCEDENVVEKKEVLRGIKRTLRHWLPRVACQTIDNRLAVSRQRRRGLSGLTKVKSLSEIANW